MSGTRVEVRVALGRATEEAAAPRLEPRDVIPRVVRLLALAHRWHGQLKRGEVESQAEIAARTGLTRARVTQIMDLRWLAPAIQTILADDHLNVSYFTERELRRSSSRLRWDQQVVGIVGLI